MNPQELIDYLPDGTKAKAINLYTKQQRSSDPVELETIIKQFQPNDGWLVLQSKVVYFYENNLAGLTQQEGLFTCTLGTQTEEAQGYFINAEMANENNESLHIVEDGDGGWIITSYKETNNEPNVLMDEISLLGKQRKNPKNQPKINYRRYWMYSKDKGYHIKAARFMGYSNGEELS